MIHCPSCGQSLGDEVSLCPNCGAKIATHPIFVGPYRIIHRLREGFGSDLYRARLSAAEEGQRLDVLLRVFKPEAGIDEEIAGRMREELGKHNEIESPLLVNHCELSRSEDGVWYRASEWVDVEPWGDLVASGFFQRHHEQRKVLDLFAQIASAIELLHQHGMIIPFLTTDDILVYKTQTGGVSVKLDFKFSRALDPDMAHPSRVLEKLLACHPDIVGKQELDIRSDIWSLGRIFTQLLAGDDEITDLPRAIEKLEWHANVKTLLRQMVEDDPALRVGSMAQVVELLCHITDEDLKKAHEFFTNAHAAPNRQIRRLTRAIAYLLILVIAVFGAACYLQYRYALFFHNEERMLSNYANKYSRSVALVAVLFWYDIDGKRETTGLCEGTAFLASSDGYLITNRHVACPWLETREQEKVREKAERLGKSYAFGYEMALWFDGTKALKHAKKGLEAKQLSDIYYLENAYLSFGDSKKVRIAGVLREPQDYYHKVRAPLRDDAAILRISPMPEKPLPLPLESLRSSEQGISKLTPVTAIGYPLGKETIPEPVLRSSATLGYVRRTFNNIIQVSVSLHPGNSGGPVINNAGKVIGIASAYASNAGSDFGYVLPIRKAADLLGEVQRGAVKWNGVIATGDKIIENAVYKLARGKKPAIAQITVDEGLQQSQTTGLLTIGGILHFVNDDPKGALSLLETALAIEPEDAFNKFMDYLCNWSLNPGGTSRYRKELLSVDWRSSADFHAYLAKTLEGMAPEEEALASGESREQRAMLRYVLGLKEIRAKKFQNAEKLLAQAFQQAPKNDYSILLIQSALEKAQNAIEKNLQNPQARDEHRKTTQVFWEKAWAEKDAATFFETMRLKKINALSEEEDSEDDFRAESKKFEALRKLDPNNCQYMLDHWIFLAQREDWKGATDCAEAFLKLGGRESANRLGMGLFRALTLGLSGNKQQAIDALQKLARTTADPWYRDIARCLLGEISPSVMEKRAVEAPQYMVTLCMALGAWSEATGKKIAAENYYSLALESYLDNWLEYQFACDRINKIRKDETSGKKM